MNFSKAHTSKKRTNLRNKDGMATLAIVHQLMSISVLKDDHLNICKSFFTKHKMV